jgi:hypothetical protein
LEALLRAHLAAQPDDDQWTSAVQEGKRRAAAKEPPGYLDAGKDESSLPEGAAGDYLVWAQAVGEATRRDADLLFVTGDEKEDWWWRYRSDFLGPRVELVEEFAAASGRQLYMMRPVDLLRRASALEVKVHSESVSDVARVSESRGRTTWPAAGVAELLRLLDFEERPQAEVIREAARLGGFIDNKAIGISGADDGGIPHDFTDPVHRITRMLSSRGIVARGVAPALTPVFSGVELVGFEVPYEMVAILSDGDDPDEITD